MRFLDRESTRPREYLRDGSLKQLVLILMYMVLVLCVGASAEEDTADDFQSRLTAGEFGPAQRLAQMATTSSARNQMLETIANAQLNAGAVRGSLLTASQISDSSHRTTTLERVRSAYLDNRVARGGGAQADFDSLIDLIVATIAPNSWEEVGGAGAIQEFEGGVFVDPQGVLRTITTEDDTGRLSTIRYQSQTNASNQEFETPSELRCVSLARLERVVELAWAEGKQPSEAMQAMAGLEKIQFIFFYPESGDIVLAGPGGGWTTGDNDRWVSIETGRPILRLDDFVVILRNAFGNQNGRFSCSIDPQQENLAQTQRFLTTASKTPLPSTRSARERWLSKLQESMGQQVITVRGIDPRTRVARIIIEADYHMKLIGMDLEDGTLDVVSYFDALEERQRTSPPPMEVIRWWLSLHCDAIHTVSDRTAFEFHRPTAKVLSENEMLSQRGVRVKTGTSSDVIAEFADRFTRHFAALAQKYPIYAELENVFDLALVTSLMRHEDMPGQVGWTMTHFRDPARYPVPLGRAPQLVDSVINHRVINQIHIVAGVSGGVQVNPPAHLKRGIFLEKNSAELQYQHHQAAPQSSSRDDWWWDVQR